MKAFLTIMVAAATLGGCTAAGGGDKSYAMAPADAERILLSADFQRGVLPGSEKLKPRVWRNHEGVVEWTVLDEANKNGWWCALAIEAASEDTTKTRVTNKCVGALSGQRNAMLDELVDAALTDREPKFDQE